MFFKCINFNSDISKWDVSSVKIMERMFYGCKSFNQDISDWDVSFVENIDNMFKFCDIKEKSQLRTVKELECAYYTGRLSGTFMAEKYVRAKNSDEDKINS